MKVLLAGAWPPDIRQGSPKVLLRLGSEMSRRNIEVDYFFADVLPRVARSHRIAWFLYPVLVLRRALEAERRGTPYDIIDVSSGDGCLFGGLRRRLRVSSGFVCRTMGWEHEDYRTRVLWNVRSRWDKWKRGLLMRTVRFRQVEAAVRSADAVITLCSNDSRYAVERGWKSADHVFVVPPGVATNFLKLSKSPRNGGLIYWGTWTPRKGVPYLVKAYERVAGRGYSIPLCIGGCWQSAQEAKNSFVPTVRQGVQVWERSLDEDELSREYQRHRIFVLPSLYEGFGMVFLEAMASGLAVVATPVGGIPDIVRDGVNGRVVHQADPEALAEAIIRLWDSPKLCQDLGETARSTAAEHTWDRVAVRTIEIYRMVLKHGTNEREELA